MDDDMVLEITHPPFGHEKAFASLYIAKVCILRGMVVTVVMRGDGVFTALGGQEDALESINLPDTRGQVEEILGLDARVVVEKKALKHRGIKEEDLVEGVETVSSEELQELVMCSSSKIITF